jgi:hypothetical protein
MERSHIEQWKIIIEEDLKDARRCLKVTCGFSARFLRDRIAEDEAILERLAAMARTAWLPGASQFLTEPSHGTSGDPVAGQLAQT